MNQIDLIGNSGIQFVDLTARLGEGSPALKVKQNYCELETDDVVELVFLEMSEDGSQFIDTTSGETVIDPKTDQPIRGDRVESVSARRVVEAFEGQWLPVPYFRRNASEDNAGFEEGPLGWARLIIQPLTQPTADGVTHSLVLSFDTTYDDAPSDTYAAPISDDLHLSSFALASHLVPMMGFLSEPWVMEWVRVCFEERKERLGKASSDESYLRHLAYYAAFVQMLDASLEFPLVRLHDDPDYEVDVDLIIDIGNSRTCGILLQREEDHAIAFNTNSARLEIRDLSMPEVLHRDAFPMQVEFARAHLGPEEAIRLSDRPNAFDWPSPVRIGYEARRRSVVGARPAYPSGMSSPKRYLWDGKPRDRDEQWRFNDARADPPSPALNEFTNQFSYEGQFLGDEGAAGRTPALRACFARGSLMTFVFTELLMHAQVQINSPAFRQQLGELGTRQTRRRRLRTVVVTCPTTMLEREKQELRRHATRAVEALRRHFGDRPPFDQIPSVVPNPDELTKPIERRREWGFDEATCAQLVFVYGELQSRFQGELARFARTYGRPRGHDQESNSVRIASVDIGGGTTDVMVCTYDYDASSPTAVVRPKPEFWEGFGLAGDDIAKKVIERCVLPPIGQHAQELGCSDTTLAMNMLFGENYGDQTALDRQLRKAFANQVAMPIALKMIQHAVSRADRTTSTYKDLFEDQPAPQAAVENYVDQKMQSLGASDFRLVDVVWTLDTREVEWAVRQVMEKRIAALCNILAQFNCDLVLLAGQPTLLPVVRELFASSLPVTPDRIIGLGRYAIGKWYPFSDARGLIQDPKTCVSSGAAVAFMAATRRLQGFGLDISQLRERIHSTAAYVGTLNPQTQTLTNVVLTPEDGGETGSLAFNGDVFLGFRQLPAPDWVAAPMYRLAFAEDQAHKLRDRMPLTVTLDRQPERPERREHIKIAGIEDNEGQRIPKEALEFHLQSLVTDGGNYWLETGSFFLPRSG